MFFILGRPRSGTTLLKTLFDAHPNVKIPPELPVLLALYQRFRKVTRWDEADIRRFVDHVFQSDRFNFRRIENFGIDREAFTRDLIGRNGKATLQELLTSIHAHSFSLYPKRELRMIGDKNPVYSIYIHRLMEIFPDAMFVCLVRDFRDNFVSLRNLRNAALEAPVLPLQVARWRIITEQFIEYRRKYPGRFYLLRYEDLVSNPETEFWKVCAFLGLPYTPGVFDFHVKKDEFLRMVPDPRILEIHQSLMNPVNTSRIGMWRDQMTVEEKRIAAGMAGETGKKMSYLTISRKLSASDYLKTRHWVIYAHLLFMVMRWSTYTPYTLNRILSRGIVRLAALHKRLTRRDQRK